MDRLVGPKVTQLCWLLFMDQRLEPERVRTLRKHLLKSFGSPKLGRLVVGDDGALLPCVINASCAALVDAGIPLKHLSDPTKAEEEKMQAFAYLVFPNSSLSVFPKASSPVDDEPGIITSVTHGLMSDTRYINCLEHGHAAACAKISEFLRKSLQTQFQGDLSKGTWTILAWPRKVQHLGAYFAATASNVQVWSLIWTILATRNYDLLIQNDSCTNCRAYELQGL
ncbi:exosome complex exonuclease RRP46 homolog isoform X2 [Elaeis guineensis]|uniref:exosome complex exonuclease RRP46 homolog isoform X2 n=1 Tax=Elaeis guineensis var. tenera TaxID=51953 RepID=UPI003C6D68EC